MKKNQTTAENTESEKQRPAKSKVRKALNIAVEVVLYAFLALCIAALIMAAVSKKNNDGAMNIFGTEMRIVVSESMAKSENSADVSQYAIKDLPLRTMVFIQTVPEDETEAEKWYSELKKGDVLTFQFRTGASAKTVTHRIIDITKSGSGYVIQLQGDNRGENGDPSIQTVYTSPSDFFTPNDDEYYHYVIGKVTGKSVVLGNIVYAVRQPVGAALIIIVPCVIIIIWQIIRIFGAVNDDRKKKALETQNQQARELDELRQKLAALESRQEQSEQLQEKKDDSGDGDV